MMRMNENGGEGTDRVVEALPVEKADQTPDPHSLGLELPDDPDEAVKLLLVELAEARDEATSYLDDLKRVAADFDNYRKRTTRDSATMFDRAAEKVVRSLMPVLDTFDAALNAEPKDGDREAALLRDVEYQRAVARCAEERGPRGDPHHRRAFRSRGPRTRRCPRRKR
jgi:molecular chaperone GrpE (heat shock protein)